MSELIREALRNYMEEREWLRTMRSGSPNLSQPRVQGVT